MQNRLALAIVLLSPSLLAAPSCPPGQVVNPDTRGHCCWPGQAWSVSRSACIGVPECPAGMAPQGDTCAIACPSGQAATADTAGHCCWPGQVWSASRASCRGVPESCPAGQSPQGETCAIACPPGQSVGPDTAGHCCWTGQAWSVRRNACIGVPESCPPGLAPLGETCTAGGGAPPPQGYPPQGYPPQGYPPQGLAPPLPPGGVAPFPGAAVAPAGTVLVTFVAKNTNLKYHVVAGTQSCDTPCSLSLPPGPVDLDITGAGQFKKSVTILSIPTTVTVNHLNVGAIVGIALTPVWLGITLAGIWALLAEDAYEKVYHKLEPTLFTAGLLGTVCGGTLLILGIAGAGNIGSNRADAAPTGTHAAAPIRLLSVGLAPYGDGLAAAARFSF